MISPAFSHSELPNQTQTILLCLLGVFLPPLPIFILTGPKYTVKTKQFLISCVLSVSFYFYLIALIYSLHFVLITFPRARLAANGAGYFGARDLENSPTAPAAVNDQTPVTPASEDLYASEDNDQPLLPAYQEVAGSKGYPADSKTNDGDNKVQH